MEPTVDDLFRWKKQVSIGDRQIWLRTLSAADDGERVKAALQEARRLRVKLLEDDSPEREELLAVYGKVSRKELLAAIRVFQIEASQSLAPREVQPKKDPPVPDEPSLDAAMDAEDEWQEELAELVSRREEWVKEQVETLMALREKDSDEKLRDMAIDLQISAHCSEAYVKEFNRQSLYYTCFEDEACKKRMFKSPGQVSELYHRVRDRLEREYYDLDRFALSSDYLKN